MADVEKILQKIDRCGNMTTKERAKFFEKVLRDEDFLKYLFDPSSNGNNPAQRKVFTEQISAMYEVFTKPESIKSFAKMLKNITVDEDNDYYQDYLTLSKKKDIPFGRSQATFLQSLVSMCTEERNQILKDTANKRQKGEITKAESTDIIETMDEYLENINKILKKSKMLVKGETKKIYKMTGMPVPIIAVALLNTPSAKYINRFRIGFYINNVLNLIYEEAFNMEASSCNMITPKMWTKFFRELYGEDNVVECATFILLEGINRYKKYENSKNVQKVWNSLTDFALQSLEDAPAKTRDQMMDLYTKRVEKMFKNNSYDLRIDLRSLSKVDYPKLFETAGKYVNVISGIINKVSK